MAADLPLTPEPTFRAKVDIPVPGKKPHKLELIFKWRDLDEFRVWFDGIGNYESDTDAIMDIASGWDHKLPFERENVEKIVKGYIGSAGAVIQKYMQENTGARQGNSGN